MPGLSHSHPSFFSESRVQTDSVFCIILLSASPWHANYNLTCGQAIVTEVVLCSKQWFLQTSPLRYVTFTQHSYPFSICFIQVLSGCVKDKSTGLLCGHSSPLFSRLLTNLTVQRSDSFVLWALYWWPISASVIWITYRWDPAYFLFLNLPNCF